MTITEGTCDCGRHVRLVGWAGPRSQDTAVYVHTENLADPDRPEACVDVDDMSGDYRTAYPQEGHDG